MWLKTFQSYTVKGWEIQMAFSFPFIFILFYFSHKLQSTKERLSLERVEEKRVFYKKKIRAIRLGMLIFIILWSAVLLLIY